MRWCVFVCARGLRQEGSCVGRAAAARGGLFLVLGGGGDGGGGATVARAPAS
jgi:hypothetical protein